MCGYGKTMFRALNKRIRLLVSPFEPDRDPLPVPFICECSDEHCFAPVAISAAEFDAVCADDEHRLIVPGHEVEGEQAVVETPLYAVVRLAHAAEAARPAHRAGAGSEQRDGPPHDR